MCSCHRAVCRVKVKVKVVTRSNIEVNFVADGGVHVGVETLKNRPVYEHSVTMVHRSEHHYCHDCSVVGAFSLLLIYCAWAMGIVVCHDS